MCGWRVRERIEGVWTTTAVVLAQQTANSHRHDGSSHWQLHINPPIKKSRISSCGRVRRDGPTAHVHY